MKIDVTALAVAAVLLLSAGCASAAPETGGPKEPPPKVPGVKSAPPPAWIETRGGDRWLAFSGYCWSATCVDPRPVAQRTDVPRIRVVRGEVVRFHLGFRPDELRLRIGQNAYRLDAQRSWRVRGRSGVAELTARASPGSAGYIARLLVR